MSIPLFINTRFNVVLKGGTEATDKAGNSTRTDKWLAQRFELFERICLPSMMNQTDTGFHWIVLFSDRTPAPFRERIAGIQARFPAFRPTFVEDGVIVVRSFRQEVQRLLRPGDTHVITARLDNDDGYHREMVARMKAEYGGQEDEFINFLNGLQWDMERNIVGAVRKRTNPFIARIERIRPGGPDTVQGVMHHEAEASGLLRNVETKPMWVQAIHGDNVLNEFESTHILFSPRLGQDFGVIDPGKVHLGRSAFAQLVGFRSNSVRHVRSLAKRMLGRTGTSAVRSLFSRR